MQKDTWQNDIWLDFCAKANAQESWAQCQRALALEWPTQILELAKALYSLQSGDGHAAHQFLQEDTTELGAWLHAHLHKIEGDPSNARYWYAQTQFANYTDYSLTEEPQMIWQALKETATKN